MHALRQIWYGSAPLVLWAAHFTLCYVWVGSACSPALLAPGAPYWPLLAAVSIAALAGCAWMLWRAPRLREDARLLDWARSGSALLALCGIAWTSLPLLLVDGCG